MAAPARLAGAAARALDEYYERCRLAELHREEETRAAVALQSCCRGCLQRMELRKLALAVLTIQRCWRGHLGRRRFAAARTAKDQQLRQAYFDAAATTIQRWWRGHRSRSRVHDYYRRRQYLSEVAAANAAVRAGMPAELQAALEHEQRQAEAASWQHFSAQVPRLHHLCSTASKRGVFSVPAAAAAGQLPVVAGAPLEAYLKSAARQRAAEAVKQQQQEAMRQSQHAEARGGGGGACKLSGLMVAAVDERYAGRAEPNMPDGRSFNPGLSLQQSAAYDAERQAGELERRVDRRMVEAQHGAQPFVSTIRSVPPSGGAVQHRQHQHQHQRQRQQQRQQQQQQHCQGQPHSSEAACTAGAAAAAPAAATEALPAASGSSTPPPLPPRWLPNQNAGSFFGKHLRRVFQPELSLILGE